MLPGTMVVALPRRQSTSVWLRKAPVRFAPGTSPEEIERVIIHALDGGELLLYLGRQEVKNAATRSAFEELKSFQFRSQFFYAVIYQDGLYWLSSEDGELVEVS